MRIASVCSIMPNACYTSREWIWIPKQISSGIHSFGCPNSKRVGRDLSRLSHKTGNCKTTGQHNSRQQVSRKISLHFNQSVKSFRFSWAVSRNFPQQNLLALSVCPCVFRKKLFTTASLVRSKNGKVGERRMAARKTVGQVRTKKVPEELVGGATVKTWGNYTVDRWSSPCGKLIVNWQTFTVLSMEHLI